MDIRVDPKLFHEFHFKIAMSVKLPITSSRLLEEFVDIDVNSETVSKIILRNQYIEHMLLHEIRALGLKDTTPTLKAAIALLGMQRVRDFVCSLQILRMVGRRHPEIDSEGKLNFKPKEYLKYALRTEEYCSLHRIQYGDTAYAAGIMFDLLAAVGKELFNAEKPYEEYVSEVYKHGLKTARIGTELAKSFKSFAYSKFVFSACLIHDIGKLAMDLLYPSSTPNSYASFQADISKVPLSREVTHFIEAKRFGLTHEYYGAQLAYYFSVLRKVERAILFHHEPYLVKNVNKELYNFTSLIALASNIANNFRIPKDTNDEVYKTWFTPDLRDFKIDPKMLMLIMVKMGRESF